MTGLSEVFLPAIAHVCLAAALSAAIFIVGLSFTRQLKVTGDGDPMLDIVFACPVGILFLVILGLLDALTIPSIGIVLIGFSVIASLTAQSTRMLLPILGKTLMLTLPATLIYGAFAASIHGGPTDHYSGGSFGDTIWYVARLETLASTGSLSANPLVEGDRWLQHELLAQGTSFVGVMLSRLPFFDSFLFFAVVVPVVAIHLTAISLHALLKRSAHCNMIAMAGIIAMFVSAGHYAGWEIESPPVAWSLVLVFSLAGLVTGDTRSWSWSILAIVLLILFALLKTLGGIFAVAVLAAPAFENLAWIAKRLGRLTIVVFLAALVSGAAASTFLYSQIGTLFNIYSLSSGFDLYVLLGSMTNSPSALYALGSVLIAAIALPISTALPVILSSTFYFVNPSILYILPSLAFCYIAAIYSIEPKRIHRQKLSLPLAGTIGLASFYTNSLGIDAGMLRLHFMTKGLAYGIIAFPVFLRAWLPRVQTLRLVFTGILAVTLIVATLDFLRRGGFGGGPLTPKDKVMWHKVRDAVPRDALVFTTFTGPEPTLSRGWNSYSGISNRQFYITGWYGSQIRFQPEELNLRLDLNQAVLEGKIKPSEVFTKRDYSSYYAVVHTNIVMPSSWRLVAGTDQSNIYAFEENALEAD